MSRDSDDLKLFLYMAGAGIFVAWGGWTRIKRLNRVKDSAKQLISAASAGQVELEAIAWPLKKIDKCLEGKDCVYLELVLEEYKKTGKSKSWVEIWRYNSSSPFIAFDQSGFVTITPSKSHMVEVDKTRTYDVHRLTGAQMVAFNKYRSTSELYNSSSFLGLRVGRTFRIREKKLRLGSPLLIHGTFVPEDKIRYMNLDLKLRDFHNKCRRLLEGKNFRHKFFDKNMDGTITREELSQGFQRALEMCIGEMKTGTGLSLTGDPHTRFFGVVTGSNEDHLHIADTFEDQYLRSSSTFLAWVSFSAGLFIFLLSLYLFAQHVKQ